MTDKEKQDIVNLIKETTSKAHKYANEGTQYNHTGKSNPYSCGSNCGCLYACRKDLFEKGKIAY